jgi:hypothetical protein
VLPGQPEQGAARDQERDVGRRGEQRREQGRGAQHLLEVVDDHEHPPRAQRRLQLVLERLVAGVEHAERLRHHVRHERRLLHGRQVDERDLGVAARPRPGRQLDREPALADAAGPEQRHEPHGRAAEQPLHLIQLPLPAEERRERRGQRRLIAVEQVVRPFLRHRRLSRGPLEDVRPALVEAVGEQGGEIRLEQPAQLPRRRVVLERGRVVVAEPVQQLGEPGLPRRHRILDVDELRQRPGEVVLVLQPGDALPRRHPAVSLGVQAHEHVALAQVGAVQLTRRMRAGAELEHHGGEVQALDRKAGEGALRRELLER